MSTCFVESPLPIPVLVCWAPRDPLTATSPPPSQTLFFGTLARNLSELMPTIYTPTEADAIAKFSHVFRRPLGAVFLTYPLQDSLEADFRSHLRDLKGRKREIDLVVVSDGEAILGIGDQGAGATGISTAKSVLYSLIAGFDPARTLAVALDVGTDNQALLDDEMYIGWRHKRVRGEDYYKFVDRFVSAVKAEFGHGTLLHFEDFGVTNAKVLLDKYRADWPVFNDDVQGTGAVTLAALYSALQVTGGKLEEQKIVCFGAGSAGLGIARQIRDAMVLDSKISKEDASKNFFMVDKEGLLTDKMKDVREGLEEFVQKGWKAGVSLEEVVAEAKPTVIIGTSTAAGAFSEKAIREMTKHCEQPIIFPLSNPTRLVEVKPEDARKWSDNKGLITTGSPFDPVDNGDGSKYNVAECNNALVYPGIGFGAVVAKVSPDTCPPLRGHVQGPPRLRQPR